MGSSGRLKFLVCSDAHVDCSTAGVPRFEDIKGAIKETVQEAFKECCGLWAFLGDWTDPDSKRAWAAAELAARTSVDVHCQSMRQLWLTGNHDVVEDGLGSSTLGCLDLSFLVTVPEVTFFGDVAFLSLPYTPISLNYDPAEEVRRLEKECKGAREVVVVGHLNAEGIEVGSETTDMPRGRDVFWPLDQIRKSLPGALLIGGHYHRRQVYEGLQIVGSLERLSFGEEHNSPGYLIVEV